MLHWWSRITCFSAVTDTAADKQQRSASSCSAGCAAVMSAQQLQPSVIGLHKTSNTPTPPPTAQELRAQSSPNTAPRLHQHQALDRWEERLEAIFDGRPYDILDAALTDTISQFPVDIQPFRDMIDGMRMDLVKSRYETYDELYGYCYRVAGTVALMSMPVMGVDPTYKVSSWIWWCWG